MDYIIDFFTSIIPLAVKFISAPWWAEFILLFYAAIFLGVIAVISVYVFLKIASIYLFVYSQWYLPSLDAIKRKRMRKQGFSHDQIEAAIRGVVSDVGRPVYRDRSKDTTPLTEDEKVYDEIVEVERQLAELDDPNSEASKRSAADDELYAAFLEENPDFLRKSIQMIRKMEKDKGGSFE